MTNPAKPARRWLDALVAAPPAECVHWPFGSATTGRGLIWVDGKTRNASRVALVLFTGKDPAGEHAAHLPVVCGDVRCVNPRHLYWATPAENNADKELDGTHQRGARNGHNRWSESQAQTALDHPGTHRQAAAAAGISVASAAKIRQRKLWTHLTPAGAR